MTHPTCDTYGPVGIPQSIRQNPHAHFVIGNGGPSLEFATFRSGQSGQRVAPRCIPIPQNQVVSILQLFLSQPFLFPG